MIINTNIEKIIKETIKKYQLFDKKDKILVALSGGKDSATVLYFLGKFGYKVEALHIDLKIGSYSEKCLEKCKELCKNLNIKLHLLDVSDEFGCRMCYIRSKVQSKQKVSNCLVCGVIKKVMLNKKARELKVNKIATGHNLDDEAQMVIMNLLKGNLELGLNSGPRTGILKDKKFVARVKPLFFVPEKEILKFSKKMNLPVIYDKCACGISSYRIRTRGFFKNIDSKTKQNIINNFLNIADKMKEKVEKSRIIYCKLCGEPARNEICKKCKLLKDIKLK
jgi:uncharacterized protein (TIGR00269 family)